MPTLAKIEYCTGCTACAAVCPKGAIVMKADEFGFIHPEINSEKCVNCALCEKSCPILVPLVNKEFEPKAFAAMSLDEKIRLESSSGGIFTEIAKTILSEGGAVFGAAYNENFGVEHVCVESESELYKLRGAKYAQSTIDGVFKEVKERLVKGQKVLFSGTPCQVGGLKAFLSKEYENLIMVDFICHSVPSPMAWEKYVNYRAEKDNGGKLPTEINLRSKISGWSRYQYSNVFTYDNGKTHTANSGESLYIKLFVGGYISRQSCENCKFKGFNRVSDITLGDFWGVWDIHPEMDDNKGTSAVIVNSIRGSEILAVLKDRIAVKEVAKEDVSKQNTAIINCSKGNENRIKALSFIKEGKLEDLNPWFIPKKSSAINRIRSLIGKILRKIIKKGP